jgi:hypothetical protein
VSNKRSRSDSNAAMKRVNSHFFSAPIMLSLLLLSVLGLCLCFFLFQLGLFFCGSYQNKDFVMWVCLILGFQGVWGTGSLGILISEDFTLRFRRMQSMGAQENIRSHTAKFSLPNLFFFFFYFRSLSLCLPFLSYRFMHCVLYRRFRFSGQICCARRKWSSFPLSLLLSY